MSAPHPTDHPTDHPIDHPFDHHAERPSDHGGGPTPPMGRLLDEPAGGRQLVAVLAVGLIALIAHPLHIPGLTSAVLLASGPAAVWWGGRRPARPSQVALGVATGLPLLLVLRASEGTAAIVVLLVVTLTALGATTASGSLLDLGLRSGILRGVEAVLHAVTGPALLLPVVRRLPRPPTGRATAVAQGLLIGIPLVLILGGLLASGDQVFASLTRSPFRVDLDIEQQVVTAIVCMWLVSGALQATFSRPLPSPGPVPRLVGEVQAMTVLTMLAALFSTFVAVQVVTAAGGARRVLDEAGLTYAEYAREGFFQLLAVAAMTAGILGALRPLVQGGADALSRGVRGLMATVVGLVLVVVATALIRLDLYSDAFGLTPTRVWAVAGCIWVGGCFIALLIRLRGVHGDVDWLLPMCGAWCVVLVTVLLAVSPEAIAVRHNLARAAAGQPFDVSYAATLSADAVPALVAGLDDLEPGDAEALRARLCASTTRVTDEAGEQLSAFNLAERRAARALASACADGP